MKICNRKQGHYNDRRIFEMMPLNEIHYNSAASTFIVSSLPRFEKLSYTKHALVHRITWGNTRHKQIKVVYCYITK
jgi:hypothetical protein